MTDAALSIEDYLARGGKLTSPANAPARYRAEVLRIMATFVDSELAGAAGFADAINDGPGIGARIAAARIVMEKTQHAERVLGLMGEFGADTLRYEASHPWRARLPREAGVGAERAAEDLRLPALQFPLAGWSDAVVMNLLMGHAVTVQLDDLARCSYQPLAAAIVEIAPAEARHTELAEAGLRALSGHSGLQASVDYWWPRIAAGFGDPSAERAAMLEALGLRRVFGAAQHSDWAARLGPVLADLGLRAP